MPLRHYSRTPSRTSASTDISKPFVNPNAQALCSGDALTIKRLPFLSFLTLPKHPDTLYQPFKSPCLNQRSAESTRLLKTKTLGLRRGPSKFISKAPLPASTTLLEIVPDEEPAQEFQPAIETTETLDVPEILLYESPDDLNKRVVVDPILAKFLRPHQVEGVQFMFNCVAGIKGFQGNGCILADDMGLGKTLQSITLLYTLLQSGIDGKPTAKKVLVVCPTSLVKNWDDELRKWLHGRVKTIALCEAGRDAVIDGISRFLGKFSKFQVLIISYETFRTHAARFDTPESCDLIICDEAHRLKNGQSQTNRALGGLACRRRVLLSGTPMQNDLEEFYAMVDFTNPLILGTPSSFRKQYLKPFLDGREPHATEGEKDLAQVRSAELSEIVNQFILRRTNTLNAKHLPPKLTQVVCCRLSDIQKQIYLAFLNSRQGTAGTNKSSGMQTVLSSITALKKLCNHPRLLYQNNQVPQGFELTYDLVPAKATSSETHVSGKMLALQNLLLTMRKKTNDRIVIVSNYTQTLDIVGGLCRDLRVPFVRLDGSTTTAKRQKLVDTFNSPTSDSFAFLLSSKAGGCGLNLIGANRLILFDPDWNPATDKQAAARVWREGQSKRCFIYRFIATGTLEEKIFQRQLSKEGLQSIVENLNEVNSLSSKNLKQLFFLNQETLSDTHDVLNCTRCKGIRSVQDDDKDAFQQQIAMPAEEDLNNWSHHPNYETVDDPVMREAMQNSDVVSFVFGNEIDGDLLERYAQQIEADAQLEQQQRQAKLQVLREKYNSSSAKKHRKKKSRVDSSSESSGDESIESVASPVQEMEELDESEKENKPAMTRKRLRPQILEDSDSDFDTDFHPSTRSPLRAHAQGQEWTCPRCTLLNPDPLTRCDGCGFCKRRLGSATTSELGIQSCE